MPYVVFKSVLVSWIYRIMQIIRGRKLLQLHAFLIREKTFAIACACAIHRKSQHLAMYTCIIMFQFINGKNYAFEVSIWSIKIIGHPSSLASNL